MQKRSADDYINEKVPYAFNEKYGYLTSYPTNVGTAMKASVVVHLPSLTMNKKFQELLGDMGRFGTTVRGVYGRGNENYGDLYEVVNQKTLGITEQEILELVANVAGQLSAAGKSVPRGFSVETPPGAGGRGVQVLRRSEICAPDDAQGSDDISISCLGGHRGRAVKTGEICEHLPPDDRHPAGKLTETFEQAVGT